MAAEWFSHLRVNRHRAMATPSGTAEDRVDETHEVEDGWAIIVPSGVWHDVINTGDDDLQLYSLYAPPQHADGTVHVTKRDAELAEATAG